MSHKLKNLFVKLFCFFSCYITNHSFFWIIISKINQIFGGNKIEALFVSYSAESKYFKYFFYDWIVEKYHWKLIFVGIHRQNGKFGLNLGLIVDEIDLGSDLNNEKLAQINNYLIDIKEKLNIPFVNFAGIIPSILSRTNQPTNQSASPLDIAKVVMKATSEIEKKYSLNHLNTTIFLLGGYGFIGQKYFEEASKLKYKIIIIEKKSEINQEIFSQNQNINNLIVNISRKGVLESYMKYLNDSYIVLNEVYPEPKIPENLFKACYHLKGIKAFILPSLPYGYSNALPCCALIPSENYEILLQEIKPYKSKKIIEFENLDKI